MSPDSNPVDGISKHREPRPEVPIAHQLRQFQRKQGRAIEEGDFSGLARKWGVPESRLRSVAGFFEEFSGRQRATDHPPSLESLAVRWLVPEPRLARPSGADGNEFELALALKSADRPAETLRASLGKVENLDRHRRKQGRPLTDRWWATADTTAAQRFVVCHADAGNPGTESGVWILENRSDAVLAGMALAALAVRADEGVIYVDCNRPEVIAVVRRAVARATAVGLLGNGFEVSVLASFGSHVGGEESALINAIEGNRGEARIRPPELNLAGVFGLPTVIESAEVFALLPDWLRRGRDEGTRLVTLSPPFPRPGLVEIDASVSLRRAIEEGGIGSATGETDEDLVGCLLGGPFGSIVFPENWDIPMDAEALADRGLAPGHWGIEPLPVSTDPGAFPERLLDFAATESCGKCAPCRLGPLAARNLLAEWENEPHRLREILETVAQTSLCGFGRDFPQPILQWLDWMAQHAQNSGKAEAK